MALTDVAASMGLANGASPVDHVPLLLATGQRFVATADQPARVPAILLEAACSVPADVAALWLADPDGQLVVAGVRHRDPLSAAALRAVLTSGDRVRPPGLVTWVHRRSRGLAAQVGTARPGMVPTRLLHYLEDNGFGTVMLTPVPGERGGLGVLATARRRDGGQFAKHERDLLQALACRAGLALETGRLQSMLRAHGAILENVADVVVAVDSSGRVAMWNHSAEHLYGAPSGSAIGSALQEFIPETEFEGVAQRAAFGEAVRDGRWSGRIRQRMPNGHRIHLDVDLLVPRGPAGDLRGYVLVGRPAGAVVTGAGGIGTTDPAGQQDRFARDLMEALDGRAAVLDTEGRVVVANRRWSADVGGRDRCSCGPVPEGTNWLAALHAAPGPDIAFFAREVASVLAGQRSLARIECRCLGGGPDRSTAVDVVQLTDERLGAVVVESDVSWRRRLEDELTHRATHDELTGLPNRYALMDSLEASLRRLRGPDKLAVFFCDLDGFKDINDGLGHAVGDQVLVAVARKLRRRCRQADIVSRFGGDEFVIVLPIAEVGQAVAMARRLVETLEEAIVVGDVEVAPGGSIGVRVVDRMPDGDDPVGLLLRDADTAMYHAKERGRGRYEFFDSRLRDNIAERLEMVAALRRATIDDELRVRYQAWRQCGDRRLVGVEGAGRLEPPARHRRAGVVHADRRADRPDRRGRWLGPAPGADRDGPVGPRARGERGGERLAPPAGRPGLRPARGRGAGAVRYPGRTGRAGDHRGRAGGGPGRGPGRPDQAARPRRLDRAGRLRHRLVVAVVPAATAGRHHQDRPLVHRRPVDRSRRLRGGLRGAAPRPRDGPAGGGRGGGAGRPAGGAAGDGLRRVPGLHRRAAGRAEPGRAGPFPARA